LAVVAARELGGEVSDVIFDRKKVFLKGNPNKWIPFVKVVRSAYYSGTGKIVIGRGYYGPTLELMEYATGRGNMSQAYSFGVQAAEVEVDTETGQAKVIRMKVIHDCGRAINPMAVEGQLEGSVCGGLGQALLENMVKDKLTGQCCNPSFLEYKMPTMADMPEISSEVIETDDPGGPFGAKESGEGVQVSTVPAITNAIFDAVGVMVKTLPVTPEKILEAIEDRSPGKGEDVKTSEN
jgi:CO/xanthine dehydrogenase Mo-binding subunit